MTIKQFAQLLATGAVVLSLTACATEWTEETKAVAWERLACQDLSRLDGDTVAGTVSIGQLSGDIPVDQAPEAAAAARDLLRAEKAGSVVNPRGGWNCEGWLWEWWKSRESYMTGYEDFTQQEAEEWGLLEGL